LQSSAKWINLNLRPDYDGLFSSLILFIPAHTATGTD
jgi:hypothetical protein